MLLIPFSDCTFLLCLQWLKATVRKGIKCGCFLVGPGPVFLVDFFCSNALIALLCKCLLAQLITASGANAVKGYLVRCACTDGTIP